MTTQAEVEKLKNELMGLFHYIQRVRKEIAAINRPADEEYHFESMADQLDAIVGATEQATNTIMATVEKNDDVVDALRAKVSDPEAGKLLDQIAENSATIFEACSFQDITGQRVNKVVKSIKYVEERVNSIVDVWGKAALDEVEVEAKEKTEDEKLLHGPALEGKGLDQDAIDALFD